MLSNLCYGLVWLGVTVEIVLFWTFVALLVHCIVYQFTGVRLYKVTLNLMDKFDRFVSKMLLG